MASNTKSRRRPWRKNKDNKHTHSKSASRKNEQLATGPTSVHDIPDDLLELILLRLRSSACLLRAASACKRWRRVITATGFLSRCLHAPSYIAGHYHAFDTNWVDHGSPSITANPAFIPCPSHVVDTRRFSLDNGGLFPDSDSGWALADSRGSLLLLSKRPTGWAARVNSRDFSDLLVCEPLTRRRQGILRLELEEATCLGVFLLDGGDRGRIISMSDFRVLAVLYVYHLSEEGHGQGTPVACVFTLGSDGGGWRVLPSASTNSTSISLSVVPERMSFAGRANGSLYWVINEGHGGVILGDDGGIGMLVLDEVTMTFSRVPFPADPVDEGPHPSYDWWSFRVIGGGGEGAPRVVRMVRNELRVLARRPGGGDGDGDESVWEVERAVRLPEATLGLPGREDWFFMRKNAMIVAAHEAYVLVTPQERTWLFSVELDTMRVERESERNRYDGQAFPSQLPWPPSLMACNNTDKRGRRRRRSCR